MKISKELSRYLYWTKRRQRNDIYETTCLMILNDNFLKSLEELILHNKININRIINSNRKTIDIPVQTSSKYISAVDLVCCSEYFINNFSKEEIERKKAIARDIVVEIVMPLGMQGIADKHKVKAKGFFASYYPTRMPCISHELYNEDDIEKVKLTFLKSSPLNEIIEYLKMIDIKNQPKKKKLKLGQAIRLLGIESNIKENKQLYKHKVYEHIGQGQAIDCNNLEQLISREMYQIYHENLSEELINKYLQRIKKIQKEINTIRDK